MLLKKLPDSLKRSFLLASVGLILVTIPYVQLAILIPLYGLFSFYDFLVPGAAIMSGPHIHNETLGFWIISPIGFLFFWSFFFLLAILITGISSFIARSRIKFLVMAANVIAVLILVGMSWLFSYVDSKLKYKAEWGEPVIATEARFVCPDGSSLRIASDGAVNTYPKPGEALSKGFIGHIDYKTKKFLWLVSVDRIEPKLVSEIRYVLENCRNVNGESLLDLYSE